MSLSETSQTGSLMRIARRRAKPGCAQAYEALVRGMFADARKIPGFQGAELIPPAEGEGEYQVILRFGTEDALAEWDHSETRSLWHQRLSAVAEGAPDYRILNGLEAWFTGPVVAPNQHPVRVRMAFITWLAIFPTVSLLLAYVAPHLESLPFLPRVALITGLVVLIMTWGIMPRLTRLFRRWLFAA